MKASFEIDIPMKPLAPPIRPFAVVALGEAMVEFTRIGAGTYGQGFGGDTSNTVVAAARQGARAAYLSRVGSDPFGAMLLGMWSEEGVDHTGISIDEHAPTGLYFISHDASGQHHFHYLRAGSAASRMTPAWLDETAAPRIRDSSWLHVSGISQAISATACDTVFAAIEMARAAGTKISYDPNLRLRLWSQPRARAIIVSSIATADLVLPGLDECEWLTGSRRITEIVDWFTAHGAPDLVIKCGEAGAWTWCRTAPTPCHCPPVHVTPVDATGAGDCFNGALLARLAMGDALHEAANYANIAAALSTTGHGAVAPIPSRQAVLRHRQQLRADR